MFSEKIFSSNCIVAKFVKMYLLGWVKYLDWKIKKIIDKLNVHLYWGSFLPSSSPDGFTVIFVLESESKGHNMCSDFDSILENIVNFEIPYLPYAARWVLWEFFGRFFLFFKFVRSISPFQIEQEGWNLVVPFKGFSNSLQYPPVPPSPIVKEKM